MPLIFTKEQQKIIDHCLNDKGMLLVPAGAGCGKTFIAYNVVKKMKPKKGLYTAFNKAIVEEGRDKFKDSGMKCSTLHALARSYVMPSKGIKELSYTSIKEDIKYAEKAVLLQGINDFFVSSSTDMYIYFNSYYKSKKLYKIACQYVEDMIENKIPCTFNFMLKSFHLMLVRGDECKYDIVILDEINDTTAVALEIFKLIDSPVKLGLGEPHQAIYQFLNLKNGFEELRGCKQLPLTNSFRCGTTIAEKIEKFMVTYVDHTFNFKGTKNPVANDKILYVTLTNGEIITILRDFLNLNKPFTLLRKASEIFAYPLAIASAAQGREVYQYKYKFLEKEYKEYNKKDRKYSFYSHLLNVVDDSETESAISLLLSLHKSGGNIFNIYEKVKKVKPCPKNTISTVFTAKGLEFETVYMVDSFDKRASKIIEEGGIQSEEDLTLFRCYYVAASRAGKQLINAKLLNK